MLGLGEFFNLLEGEPRSDGRFCKVEGAIYTSPDGNWWFTRGEWKPYHGAPPPNMVCTPRDQEALYVYHSQVEDAIGCLSELAAKLQFAMTTSDLTNDCKFVAWVEGVHCFIWDGQEYSYAGTVPGEDHRPKRTGHKVEAYDGVLYSFPAGYHHSDWNSNGRLYRAQLELLFDKWVKGTQPYVSYPADKALITAACNFMTATKSQISEADFPGCDNLVFQSGDKAWRHLNGVWGLAANVDKLPTWIKFGGNTLYIPADVVEEFKHFPVEAGLSLRQYLGGAVDSADVDAKLKGIITNLKAKSCAPRAYLKCPNGEVFVLHEHWDRAVSIPEVSMTSRTVDGYVFGVTKDTDPMIALDRFQHEVVEKEV